MGALLNRRRYMGGVGSQPLPPLPQGGVRIEYLQFVSNCYIDTGFVPDYNSSMELVVKINAGNTFICGSSILYGNRAFEFYSFGNTQIETNYGSKYLTNIMPYTRGNRFKIALDKNIALSYDLQGNELSRYVIEEQTFTCPNTLTLGALHRGSNGQTITLNTVTFDMGAVVLKDNGTIVRNYIPARIGTVGYMFDTLSEQYYGNDGTGSFVLGPDI